MALVRTCDGCGQTDDHPRMIIAISADPASDRAFHYDCVPHYLRANHPTPAYDATADGKRGADVAQVVIDAQKAEEV